MLKELTGSELEDFRSKTELPLFLDTFLSPETSNETMGYITHSRDRSMIGQVLPVQRSIQDSYGYQLLSEGYYVRAALITDDAYYYAAPMEGGGWVWGVSEGENKLRIIGGAGVAASVGKLFSDYGYIDKNWVEEFPHLIPIASPDRLPRFTDNLTTILAKADNRKKELRLKRIQHELMVEFLSRDCSDQVDPEDMPKFLWGFHWEVEANIPFTEITEDPRLLGNSSKSLPENITTSHVSEARCLTGAADIPKFTVIANHPESAEEEAAQAASQRARGLGLSRMATFGNPDVGVTYCGVGEERV